MSNIFYCLWAKGNTRKMEILKTLKNKQNIAMGCSSR